VTDIGADFLRQLLNPPPAAVHPNPPTYLYNTLTQIAFPPNVTILPDKQLEKRKRQEEAAQKAQLVKMEAEAQQEVVEEHQEAVKERDLRQKQIRRNLAELREYLEKKRALEEHAHQKLFSFLGQFYGRWK
jgi:hypothetical protein